MRNQILLILALVFMGTSATAADVYINGQKLGAVADIEMKNVSVRFDAKGDIYITAPGYDVVAPGGANQDTEMPEKKLLGTYCMVADTDAPGVVPFTYELFVNGNKIGEFASDQSTVMLPLTEHIQVGKNTVGIKAHHDASRMVSPPMRRKAFRIRAGEGVMTGGQCTLSTSPILYTRLARDTGDRENSFTFVAR